MKITSIKQQLRNPNRFSIYVDNKYRFAVSDSELITLGLQVGQTIDKSSLLKVNSELSLSNAKNACLKLLSYRARSEWEIQSYLQRKKYDPITIKQTKEYLTSKGYIDDSAFARQWIENRLRLKTTSKKFLRFELRQKKVPEGIIEDALSSLDFDEIEQIRQIIAKKRTIPRFADNLKLMQYLARQGFDYDKIKQALQPRS